MSQLLCDDPLDFWCVGSVDETGQDSTLRDIDLINGTVFFLFLTFTNCKTVLLRGLTKCIIPWLCFSLSIPMLLYFWAVFFSRFSVSNYVGNTKYQENLQSYPTTVSVEDILGSTVVILKQHDKIGLLKCKILNVNDLTLW